MPSASVMSLVQSEAESNARGGEVLTGVLRGSAPTFALCGEAKMEVQQIGCYVWSREGVALLALHHVEHLRQC